GLLREVVVHAERGLPFLVHEVLGDGTARVWGDVLQRRRFGSGGDDNNGVIHRARFAQLLHYRSHGRALLADGDVDAGDALTPLVGDRVDRDGRLAGAAVADNQLTLSPADGDHRIDRLDTRLERLFHRLPHNDAGGNHLDWPERAGLDLPPAIHWSAERVDD